MPDPDGWLDQDGASLLLCLVLAREGEGRGEVPVGALLRDEAGRCLAPGANEPIASRDPTAHAEIVALRRAARRVGNYRLTGACLAVSLSPCPLCRAAMDEARVGRVIHAAQRSTPHAHVPGAFPAIEQACGDALRKFFEKRRHP